MSIITDILEKITGLDLDGSDKPAAPVTERPCSNCPSNCALAGPACDVCVPYKKKLIDWVYHVDHLEEFLAQYEVVSPARDAASYGTTHCPFCGANSADPYNCEYCGSVLSEKPAPSGKIQVSAASEIPNPIMEAQNVIWERYKAVIGKKQAFIKTSIKGSLIGDLFSQLFTSENGEEEEESQLGAKMSEAEIREAASLYKVTVGEYLTGLDNGRYLTLSGKKEADAQKLSGAGLTPESIGLPGMAAVGGFAGSIFRDFERRRKPSRPQETRRPSSSNESRRPSSDELQRPSRPARPEETRRPSSDELQRPSRPASSERRRPDSRITPNQAKEIPRRPSSGNGPSGNRRDNLINRETGERMKKPGGDRS